MENRWPSKDERGKYSREYQHEIYSHHRIKDASHESRSHHHSYRTRATLPALSGDADYVRQWLVQTDQESKMVVRNPSVDMVKSEKMQRPKQALQIFCDAADELEDTRTRHGKRRRRRNSSSDSSLLEPAIRPKSTEQKIPGAALLPRTSSRTQRRGEAEPSDAGSSTPSVCHQETFEKRPRHKTREDLYDHTKKKRKRKPERNDEEKPKPRRTKRGDGKKAARNAGKDLMGKFTSKSVSQNRLTIRPSQKLGLFNHGRASSPAKRRGLPDLAFSEMEFLQRSTQVTSKPGDKVTTKSRGSEVRRAERAQDEISTFFRRAKSALDDVSPNVRHKRSSHEDIPKPRQISQYPRSASFGFPENFISEPRQSASSHPLPNSGEFSTFKNRSSDGPDTRNRYSGRAATYISWSETQFSPPHYTAKSRQISTDRSQVSPIPDSVRLSIERTGIFRGTGIALLQEKRLCRNDIHPSSLKTPNSAAMSRAATEDSINRSPDTLARRISSTGTRRGYLKSPTPRNQSRSPRRSPFSRSDGKGASFTQPVEEQTHDQRTSDSTTRPNQVTVEHNDRKSGWHQCQSSKSPENLAQKHQTRSMARTPVDRKQLAQKARIECRSTTLPVASIATKARDRQAKHSVTSPATSSTQNFARTPPERASADPQSLIEQDRIRNEDTKAGQQRKTELSAGTSLDQHGSIESDNGRNLKSNLPKIKFSQSVQANEQLEEDLLIRHDNSTRHPKVLNSEPFDVGNDTSVLWEPQSWIGRRGGCIAPYPLLPSTTGVASLYIHQMEQSLAEFPEIFEGSYAEYNGQLDLDKYLAEPYPRLNSNWHIVEGGVFTENEHDLHQFQLDDGEFEAYSNRTTDPFDKWQVPEPTPTEEIDDYGLNQDVEQSMAYPYEVQNELRRPVIVPPNDSEYIYQQPDYKEDIHVQRFWRPNRQY